MKNKYFCIICSLLTIFSPCHSQNWVWAKSAGGPDWDYGTNIVSDNIGNIYVSGIFSSDSMTFGSYTLFNSNGNQANYFIVKYDSNGTVLWAKHPQGITGSASLSAFRGGLGVDNESNLYITGSFISDSIIFDNFILRNDSAPFVDMFLVKYDSAGSVRWATKSTNHNKDDLSTALALDPLGNIYVTGVFQYDSIRFGNTTLIDTDNAGAYHFYVVKYDSSGNVIWAQCPEGNLNYISYDIATDILGNVFVAGNFNGDSIHFNNFTLYNSTNLLHTEDIFLVKYDPSGNALWAKCAGGNDRDDIYSISTDAAENIYVVGDFSSDSIRLGNIILMNNATDHSKDIFIVKYDLAGNVIWAHGIGGLRNDICHGLAAYLNGDFYISGRFNSLLISFGNFSFNRGSGTDLFFVRYDSSGIAQSAVQVSGTEIPGTINDADNDVSSIAISKTNNNIVYATGTMSGVTLPLGNIILTNTPFYEKWDVFVAALSDITSSIGNPLVSDEYLTAFPNPFTSTATIKLSHELTLADLELRMFDICGREVVKFTIRNQPLITIHRNGLEPGVYFYVLLDKKGFQYSGKICLQ